MKKILFMFVALIAISFTSCGNKAMDSTMDNDSISQEAVDMLIDSLSNVNDSTIIKNSIYVIQ